ncbi:hypothetical protein NC652_001927 [Populus alba x Populus x berolinensis]|nr:hypothetical protein NC652_001927 [Populus alba x Populus x berolinensis]
MAATRESIKGNGSSVQGALFRDRCCRRWWTKGEHRATCTTFLEGQIWKSSKTMAMTWLTQSSLAEFRSVFGNSLNIIGIASAYLFLSVPIDTRRCAYFYYSIFFIECFNLVYDMGFCNNNNNVLVFLKIKKCLGFLRREQRKCKGGSFCYIVFILYLKLLPFDLVSEWNV